MNITIVTVGSRGDVQPYVALGTGFKSAGYPVKIATSTTFQSLIEGAGLDFFPLGDDIREVIEGEEGLTVMASRLNPATFFKRLVDVMTPYLSHFFDTAIEASRDADVIVTSTLSIPACLSIAEKFNKPMFQAYPAPVFQTREFGSVVFPSIGKTLGNLSGVYNIASHKISEQLLWQVARGVVNKMRREKLNLPPLPFWGLASELEARRWPVAVGVSPHVLPQPADWAEFQRMTGYWFLDNHADWQPPADLVTFLAESRKADSSPIYIGFGSMSDRDADTIAKIVLDAIAQTGVRAVISAGWGTLSKADNLPPHVFRLDSIPHDWLFPQMRAIVHHGGAGTTAASLRAGVPSILVPFVADQGFWADRVYALGVGPKPIPRRALTAERLAQAINTAVSDTTMQQKAAKLGAAICAEDGIGNAVRMFQEYFG